MRIDRELYYGRRLDGERLSTKKPAQRRARDDILDALPDAVMLVDHGVIVDANAAAAHAFTREGTLAGVPLRDVLSEGEWERLEVRDAQRARGWAVPSMCRLRFRRPDGTTTTADVRIGYLPGSQIVLSARDAEYMTRGEDLANRLAQLPSGMDGADALFEAAEPVFRALGWTVAFLEIYEDSSQIVRVSGPAGDAVGDYGRALLGKIKPFEETAVVAEIVRTGEPLFLDNLPATQPGPIRRAVALSDSMDRAGVARSAWCPIHAGGVVTHVLSAAGQDMTEHDFVAIQLFAAQLGAAVRLRALRQEMVHRERLAAVGEMAAVLAHEVRNSLGVIFAAIGALGRADPARRIDWQSLLIILQDEADRLQRLVADLLEFSSRSTPALEPVLLEPVVQDALQGAEHDASFVSAEPVVRVDVAQDLVVRSDRILLRRVLLNVVVNAVQHVTGGGDRRRSRDGGAPSVAERSRTRGRGISRRGREARLISSGVLRDPAGEPAPGSVSPWRPARVRRRRSARRRRTEEGQGVVPDRPSRTT